MAKPKKVSFLVFFCMWAERMRWTVPEIHARACIWLENKGELAVLRCFRGFAKSTILGVYNAWRYYKDESHRILHQSEADGTAYKTSRDTQNVLRNHPLTQGMLPNGKGTVEQWWVTGAEDMDPRNASMYAKGILSNVTSARADECQNDDVEVPRNIQTPEAREKLRYRLGEQTHILVPGGSTLYVGTPHTHDSLYDEMEAMGADCLTIKMFQHEFRVETVQPRRIAVPFVPEFVFAGIGKTARVLSVGKDYRLTTDGIELLSEVQGLIDFYANSAWPERFDAKEMQKRRRKCRTINEWDSQYQLHSKPIRDIRLNPDRMRPYDIEPTVRRANGEVLLMLGSVRLVGVHARWDCSLGKIDSDASALCIIFTDEAGNLYWHRAVALVGELEEFGSDGKILVGGQIKQLADILQPLNVPNVVIETNGPGGFVPAIARKHLKRLGISVTDDFAKSNKNKDILDAFEGPLSSGFLWAHTSVDSGPAADQMLEFNPAITTQADDYLDAAARAIKATPVRIGRVFGNPNASAVKDWRPSAGVFEVELEHS